MCPFTPSGVTFLLAQWWTVLSEESSFPGFPFLWVPMAASEISYWFQKRGRLHFFLSRQYLNQLFFILFFRGLACFLCYPWFWVELLVQNSFCLCQRWSEGLIPPQCSLLLTVEAVLDRHYPAHQNLSVPSTGFSVFIRWDLCEMWLSVPNPSLSINKYVIIK